MSLEEAGKQSQWHPPEHGYSQTQGPARERVCYQLPSTNTYHRRTPPPCQHRQHTTATALGNRTPTNQEPRRISRAQVLSSEEREGLQSVHGWEDQVKGQRSQANGLGKRTEGRDALGTSCRCRTQRDKGAERDERMQKYRRCSSGLKPQLCPAMWG